MPPGYGGTRKPPPEGDGTPPPKKKRYWWRFSLGLFSFGLVGREVGAQFGLHAVELVGQPALGLLVGGAFGVGLLGLAGARPAGGRSGRGRLGGSGLPGAILDAALLFLALLVARLVAHASTPASLMRRGRDSTKSVMVRR